MNNRENVGVFESVPKDIMNVITSYLDIKSFTELASVNFKTRNLCMDKLLNSFRKSETKISLFPELISIYLCKYIWNGNCFEQTKKHMIDMTISYGILKEVTTFKLVGKDFGISITERRCLNVDYGLSEHNYNPIFHFESEFE